MRSAHGVLSALVTGGSRGIGLAMASMLAAEGHELTLVASEPTRLAAACDALCRGGAAAQGVAADLRDGAAIIHAVREHQLRFGRLDVLVNAAGVLRRGPVDASTTADVDEVLAVNLRAPILLYRAGSRCCARLGPRRVGRR
jgi:3-oxoacyl-[acyl-carrier protein] reductase